LFLPCRRFQFATQPLLPLWPHPVVKALPVAPFPPHTPLFFFPRGDPRTASLVHRCLGDPFSRWSFLLTFGGPDFLFGLGSQPPFFRPIFVFSLRSFSAFRGRFLFLTFDPPRALHPNCLSLFSCVNLGFLHSSVVFKFLLSCPNFFAYPQTFSPQPRQPSPHTPFLQDFWSGSFCLRCPKCAMFFFPSALPDHFASGGAPPLTPHAFFGPVSIPPIF